MLLSTVSEESKRSVEVGPAVVLGPFASRYHLSFSRGTDTVSFAQVVPLLVLQSGFSPHLEKV